MLYSIPLTLPDPKLRTQRLFNRIAASYARWVFSHNRAQTRQDVEWISPHRHERVLDLACGPGTLGLELLRHGCVVYGLDLAERMIAEARRIARARQRPNIHFGVADAEHLPLPDNSFNLVVCGYSFANFPAPQRVVQEIARVTRPGGRIAVLVVVAPENAAERQQVNRLEQMRSDALIRILCLSDLLALFHQVNLHLLDCHVARQRQRLHDWLALAEFGDDHRARLRLREVLLRTAKNNNAGVPLRRQGGHWFLYHKVARLLWRK